MTKRAFRTKEARQDTLAMTLEDVADLLGIGIGLVRGMADKGQLPTMRIGKLLRVSRPKLMAILEETPIGKPAERPKGQTAK